MNSDPKSYKFMKETIKKEPPDRKKWLLRCLLFFCAAVIFGLIAALTFAVAEPKISAALNGPERVDIPADEAPDPEGDASAEAEVTETPHRPRRKRRIRKLRWKIMKTLSLIHISEPTRP